jgi:branched-chain amino acid transport system ATP-binding protein
MTTLCEVRGGSRNFGAVQALSKIDLSISEKEIVGIVGPNGSGKTTLFNCMSGFHRLSAGRLIWRDQDITGWSMERIARAGLVRTFQQSMHFSSRSVEENVRMALDIARANSGRRKASEELNSVGDLLEVVDLTSIADEPSAILSHGQLRRLGIALALAVHPTLLLLDEPAAGLTDSETAELSALLVRIRELGTTLCVVDHDMGFLISLVDRMVVLSSGRKLTEGPPEQVRNDPAVIEIYLGTVFNNEVGSNTSPAGAKA